MTDAWLGRTLSHYEIVEKLGEGGMGVVYKARDTRLGRFVAIKILPPDKVSDVDRTRRFVRRPRPPGLNHPNIIHDIAEDHGSQFMVMGTWRRTLDHVTIRRFGLRLMNVELCRAGGRCAGHRTRSGIIHRDLKPSNVMVTERAT
jgi:serine/threonine protein kinase